MLQAVAYDAAVAPRATRKSGSTAARLRENVTQRVQSTHMVQSMVSVVVISLMVWVSIPHMST